MTEQMQRRAVPHRLAVIRHAEEVTGNVSKTCRYYGISRRSSTSGSGATRSTARTGCGTGRRARSQPPATSAEVVGKIIYLRQNYHFGPQKIAMYLKRYHDDRRSARPGCGGSSSAST